MNLTVSYGSSEHHADCRAKLRSRGLPAVSALIHQLLESDAIIVAEYPDDRKQIFTSAGNGEVYIEAYDGGIEGRIVTPAAASEFLNGLLTLASTAVG